MGDGTEKELLVEAQATNEVQVGDDAVEEDEVECVGESKAGDKVAMLSAAAESPMDDVMSYESRKARAIRFGMPFPPAAVEKQKKESSPRVPHPAEQKKHGNRSRPGHEKGHREGGIASSELKTHIGDNGRRKKKTEDGCARQNNRASRPLLWAEDRSRSGSRMDDRSRMGSRVEDRGRKGSRIDDRGRIGSRIDIGSRVGSRIEDRNRKGSRINIRGRVGSSIEDRLDFRRRGDQTRVERSRKTLTGRVSHGRVGKRNTDTKRFLSQYLDKPAFEKPDRGKQTCRRNFQVVQPPMERVPTEELRKMDGRAKRFGKSARK